MCKSDRKVRQFNSAQTAEFVIFSLTWRAAHKAGWFDDWNQNNHSGHDVPSKGRHERSGHRVPSRGKRREFR